MWKSGATPKTESSSPIHIQAWQASALNATFECVSIAPLGLPVVPEV